MKKIIVAISVVSMSMPVAAQLRTDCASYQGQTRCVSRESASPYPTPQYAAPLGNAIGTWLGRRQAQRQERAAEQQEYEEDQAQRLRQARPTCWREFGQAVGQRASGHPNCIAACRVDEQR